MKIFEGKPRMKKAETIFTMTALVAGILFTAVMTQAPVAYAHQDPDGDATQGEATDCSTVGVSVVGVESRGGVDLPVGANKTEGETVQHRVVLAKSNATTGCAFYGGSITITTPNGVAEVLSDVIPCVGGTTAPCDPAQDEYVSTQHDYLVNCADDGKNGDPIDGFLRTKYNYAGFSHANNGDDLTASGSNELENPCITKIVGGEILGVDSAALLIGGVFGGGMWMILPVIIAGIASALIAVFRMQTKRVP